MDVAGQRCGGDRRRILGRLGDYQQRHGEPVHHRLASLSVWRHGRALAGELQRSRNRS